MNRPLLDIFTQIRFTLRFGLPQYRSPPTPPHQELMVCGLVCGGYFRAIYPPSVFSLNRKVSAALGIGS